MYIGCKETHIISNDVCVMYMHWFISVMTCAHDNWIIDLWDYVTSIVSLACRYIGMWTKMACTLVAELLTFTLYQVIELSNIWLHCYHIKHKLSQLHGLLCLPQVHEVGRDQMSLGHAHNTILLYRHSVKINHVRWIMLHVGGMQLIPVKTSKKKKSFAPS